MGKNKLKKFNELAGLKHVIQPEFDEVFGKDYYLKGKWKSHFFKNNNPIVLELGCGKGEYSVGLATKFPDKNFIGIDIKGARIWKGAKDSATMQLKNIGFIRTRIEFIASFFAANEVEEIWLTFPDPQLKKARNKKRLSGDIFLNIYRNFLVDNGLIHLKTDNAVLYQYTHNLAKYNNLSIEISTSDLYGSGIVDDILSIQTFYESQYRNQGININYLRFKLPNNKNIEGLTDED